MLIAAVTAFVLAAAPQADHIITINPGCDGLPPSMKRWKGPFTAGELREWAAARGLRLHPDEAPLSDNCAAMVTAAGSTAVIDGLDRSRRYRLWVDFVRFVVKKGTPPRSSLRLEARAGMHAYMTLAEYEFGSLPRGPVAIDLPYELSAAGRVELRFTEMSLVPGSWGVWDVLVSDGEKLPAEIDPGTEEKGRMDVDIKPLE